MVNFRFFFWECDYIHCRQRRTCHENELKTFMGSIHLYYFLSEEGKCTGGMHNFGKMKKKKWRLIEAIINVKLSPIHTEIVVVLLNLHVIYNTQHSRKYVIELLLYCGFLQGKDYLVIFFFAFLFPPPAHPPNFLLFTFDYSF